jgi:hypothetical protein
MVHRFPDPMTEQDRCTRRLPDRVDENGVEYLFATGD